MTRSATAVMIRPADEGDYGTLVAISNAVFTEYLTTVEALRFADQHRDPKCKHQRYIAEIAGQAVGTSEYGQPLSRYHPQKFFVGLTVLPTWAGQGIGTALYNHLLQALMPFNPISISGQTRESWPQAITFLEHRGFVEMMRSWESRLDVASFDPTPFAAAVQNTLASGITVRTISELAADPNRDRKLYEVYTAICADIPSPEPYTPLGLERYIETQLQHPDLLPDAYFVAIDETDGTYAGISQLWSNPPESALYNGETGVRRQYRRRGIALALKLRGIAYAQQQRHPTIKTWNETNNRAMLGINERLGFVRQPAWIDYTKVFDKEHADTLSAHKENQ